ncbi:MAG: AI-2E family transporter [Chloroflexota bacterium]|nr:AI-2E family transporter [Chloroflexota bacterium]
MMRAQLVAWAVRGMGLAMGVAVVYALGALAIAAAGVLLLVFVAILFASALEPFVGWIRGHVGLGRGPTILLVYAAFLVLVVAMALIVVPAAIGQFNEILVELPPLVDRARHWAATLQPAGLGASIRALVDAASALLTPKPPDPNAVVRVGLTVVEAVVSLVTLLAIVYFWLVEHARLQRFVLAFLPGERRAGARDAWNEIENRLGLWVRGQLILMATMGIATGAAYFLLGVPSALLLGLIAALTEAIPIVGPLLGAVPALLVAATVSPQLALAVAVVYLVVQLVEGNILVPLVMRNTIGLSPFLVVVSLLIGGAAGGLLGALFAVPVAAATLVVLERLQDRDVPIAQDPSPTEVDPAEAEAQARSLPDAAAGKP